MDLKLTFRVPAQGTRMPSRKSMKTEFVWKIFHDWHTIKYLFSSGNQKRLGLVFKRILMTSGICLICSIRPCLCCSFGFSGRLCWSSISGILFSSHVSDAAANQAWRNLKRTSFFRDRALGRHSGLKLYGIDAFILQIDKNLSLMSSGVSEWASERTIERSGARGRSEQRGASELLSDVS